MWWTGQTKRQVTHVSHVTCLELANRRLWCRLARLALADHVSRQCRVLCDLQNSLAT